jgi:hypothetical protein
MQKGAPAFVGDASQSPLEQEGRVLKYFEDHFTTNIKKLKKLALRLMNDPEVPAHAKRGVVSSVLKAGDPVKFLKEAFKEINDIPIIMQALRDDGNHGMIMDQDQIYGFEIRANPKWLRRDDRWNPDDEQDIMNDSIEAFMEKHLLQSFRGKILLFKEFGFSGMPRMVDQAFTQEYYEQLIFKVTC